MKDHQFQISLLKICIRQSMAHKLRTALLIFGIAMGVAGVVAIDIAKTSVSKSFDLSFAAITQKTTHQIIGSNFKIPQAIFTDLRKHLGIDSSAPVINTHVRVREMNNRILTLTGIDPFSETRFRDFTIQAQEGRPEQTRLSDLLGRQGGVLISKQDGKDYGIEPGNTITLLLGKRMVRVIVIGFLDSGDPSMSLMFEGLILSDIAHAQEILEMGDQISRIDLILDDIKDQDRIAAILPPGTLMVETDSQNKTLRKMSNAFETSLTAFSMLALFMGIFLIYNTVSFSVAQRQILNGTLRALGATRKDIFNAVILEIMIFAMVGSALGLLLGVLLGNGAVKVVCNTVSDVYFVLTVSKTHIAVATMIKGFVAGMVSSFAAGFFPAYSASLSQPITLMQKSSPETKIKKLLPWITLTGFLITLLTAAGMAMIDIHSGIDFMAVFLIFLGYSLLAPAVIIGFTWGLKALSAGFPGVLFRMAVGDLSRALSRTSVLIASLMVVISVYIGVDVMTHSFRMSIIEWVDGNIGGDIHLESVDELNRPLDYQLLSTIEQYPEVEAVSAYNIHRIFSKTSGEVHIFSYIKDLSEKRWEWTAVKEEALNKKLSTGWIYVSEIFAKKNNVVPGSGAKVAIETRKGPVEFKIAGIFRDYFMGGGRVIVSRPVMAEYFGYTDITAMQIFLKPDRDTDRVMNMIEDEDHKGAMLEIRSGQTIKKGILAVFDKTFIITKALQVLTAVVALTGILNSVMALILERTRELGILRACGAERKQLKQLLLTECGLAGLFSGVMALPLGIFLSWVLIHIVNQRSFGWTYDMTVSPGIFLQAIFLSTGAAVISGIYPAVRAGRTEVGKAIRME